MTYNYGAAKALVALHEIHLRSFFQTWQQAKAATINLPETKDADYQSLEHLLHHNLRAARGYIVWICTKLDLPEPEINEVPALAMVEAEAEAYLEHLLERWRLPLVKVEGKRFRETFTSNWGIDYCIDAMLEHAVMHPIRHEFQLNNLLASQA